MSVARTVAPSLLGLVLRLVMLPVILLATGCSAPPAADAVVIDAGADPWDVAPADFSIDLTVMAGAGVEPRPEVHLRHGRFVLLADGTLRYSPDPDAGPASLPHTARTLTRRQMAETWSLLQQLGLADRSVAAPPSNFMHVEPVPGELVYLLAISGDEQRWAFIRAVPAGEAADTATGRLVRYLARLAWAADELPASRRVTVRRYDFGPDPYERFRR